MKKGFRYTLFVTAILLLTSCSTTKYVPEGSHLLDEVRIQADSRGIKSSSLLMYVHQNPNSRWFSLIKTQLYVYNWLGRDSASWMNRTLRRMGDAPVIYKGEETGHSSREITRTIQNTGYMGAVVGPIAYIKKKKLKLTYRVPNGKSYKIRSLKYDIKGEKIREYVRQDSADTYLAGGMYSDINRLDAKRRHITNNLLRDGYYKFNKEYISHTADTVRDIYQVDVTMYLVPFRQHDNNAPQNHRQYYINKVNFITDYNVLEPSALSSIEVNGSIHYKGSPIYYKDKLYLRLEALTNNLHITPGDSYDEPDVQRAYSNFGRLQTLRYINIRFFETQVGDTSKLSAYTVLTKSKYQSVSSELEETNSAGGLEATASVSFQNRNMFKDSETLMVKLRGAYEAASGLQGGYNHKDYTESGAKATVSFPRFLFPFLPNDFRRKIRTITELGMQYNYQIRPEFSRIITSANWSYKWGLQRQRAQHHIDLLNINYLYMPSISQGFRDKYLNDEQNYILRYNYDGRLIVRTGYSCTYNSAGQVLMNNTITDNSYSIRVNSGSVGNLLYAVTRMADMRRNEDGGYSLLSIPFAQYVKGDFDFAKNIVIDSRNSIASHVGAGIAVPYGSATTMPFEKRYFSDGADSVRDWSVCGLGPSVFPGDRNFMNQSGNVKLNTDIEYHTRLLWKFGGVVFVGAGSIWTLRGYKDQPGGKFEFNEFYRQIVVAYGLGLRLDLDSLILRFDGGMKTINPVFNNRKEYFPVIHPKFSCDSAFHFTVEYPF